MRKLRSRLSYANVVSTLCLFILLGGGAYAATRLPANSVGARQLKKNAVGAAKIKDGSVETAKLGDEAVSAAKLAAGAVISVKLADGSVLGGKVADGAVTRAKLGNAAVGASNLGESPDEVFLGFEAAASAVSSHEAQCPSGTRMLAGGVLNEVPQLHLLGSYPSGENRWKVIVSNETVNPIPYAMLVTCLQ